MQFILGVGSEKGTLKIPPKRMKRPVKNNNISVCHSEGRLSNKILLR